MAKKQQSGLKLFNMAETYAGGGFADGRYRFTDVKFAEYDFGGRATNGAVVALFANLVPLDGGKEVGEPQAHYWPAEAKPGNLEIINDGAGVQAAGDYATIWKQSDFYIFMESLQKAKFDMDAHEDDDSIEILEGMEADLTKFIKKDSRQSVDGDTAKKNFPVVIVAGGIKMPGSGKSTGKSTPEKKGQGFKNVPTKKNSVDPEELLGEYLESEVLVEKNEGGIKRMQARMGISKWANTKGLGAEVAKEIIGQFNNAEFLDSLLTASGWTQDGDTIKKEE